MVWKASTEIGVGVAVSPGDQVFTVAKYKPKGNFGFKKDYITNVQPAGKIDLV